MSLYTEKFIKALREVLTDENRKYPLHEPSFQGNEWKYVKDCIDTGWVSSVGSYVDEFEKKIADYTGTKFAISLVNGTSALHLALKVAGVSKDDEVIIPALSFIATANAVSYLGAFPHFVDSDEKNLGIDVEKLAYHLEQCASINNGKLVNKLTGRRISAIVPMHTFGHVANMDALLKLSKKYELPLIEDASEAIGSYWKHQHSGTLGVMGVFSFNGNKTITAGGGGAIITNDENLANEIKHLSTTAKIPHKWEYQHDAIGFNYRLPNINAALGLAQLESLDHILEKKRKLAENYKNIFSELSDVRFIDEPEKSKSNFWLNTVLIQNVDERDRVLKETNDAGILTRPCWQLLSKQKMFQGCFRSDLITSEMLEKRLLNIPSSVSALN